jgi:hypothetical protein
LKSSNKQQAKKVQQTTSKEAGRAVNNSRSHQTRLTCSTTCSSTSIASTTPWNAPSRLPPGPSPTPDVCFPSHSDSPACLSHFPYPLPISHVGTPPQAPGPALSGVPPSPSPTPDICKGFTAALSVWFTRQQQLTWFTMLSSTSTASTTPWNAPSGLCHPALTHPGRMFAHQHLPICLPICLQIHCRHQSMGSSNRPPTRALTHPKRMVCPAKQQPTCFPVELPHPPPAPRLGTPPQACHPGLHQALLLLFQACHRPVTHRQRMHMRLHSSCYSSCTYPAKHSCPPVSPCAPPHPLPKPRLETPPQACHPGLHQALTLLFHACHAAPHPPTTPGPRLHHGLRHLYGPYNAMGSPVRPTTRALTRPCCCCCALQKSLHKWLCCSFMPAIQPHHPNQHACKRCCSSFYSSSTCPATKLPTCFTMLSSTSTANITPWNAPSGLPPGPSPGPAAALSGQPPGAPPTQT